MEVGESISRSFAARQSHRDMNDCSVIAVSLAGDPDGVVHPEVSYAGALKSLRNRNKRLKPWKKKLSYESERQFWNRRVRQFVWELKPVGIPRHKNPIYGTETNVYAYCLTRLAYSLVFGEPSGANTFCLCIAKGIWSLTDTSRLKELSGMTPPT